MLFKITIHDISWILIIPIVILDNYPQYYKTEPLVFNRHTYIYPWFFSGEHSISE